MDPNTPRVAFKHDGSPLSDECIKWVLRKSGKSGVKVREGLYYLSELMEDGTMFNSYVPDDFELVTPGDFLRVVSQGKVKVIPSKDNINPNHYKEGGIEVIDILKAKLTPEEFQGFLKGNIVKYTLRARLKNGEEDIKKAEWYAKFLAGNDPRKI